MKVGRYAGQKNGVLHGLNHPNLLLLHIRFNEFFALKTFNESR